MVTRWYSVRDNQLVLMINNSTIEKLFRGKIEITLQKLDGRPSPSQILNPRYSGMERET